MTFNYLLCPNPWSSVRNSLIRLTLSTPSLVLSRKWVIFSIHDEQVMDTVDNVTKECLSNCEDQVNDLFVTTSNYPNRKTFKDREEFCILGRKLLTQTCKFPKRLPLRLMIILFPVMIILLPLSADFPNLCETLETLPDFLQQCKNNR